MASEWIAERYRIVGEMGRAAAGPLWLAHDETLRRDVVLKPIPHWWPLRQARLAARLKHPNAVAIHDVVVADGQPWLVMEYIRGETLADVVAADGPLEPRRAAAIGAALGSALTTAHDLGIVHGEVTPSAVLLVGRDHPKLADFGLGRDPTLTTSDDPAGASPYRAPEVASGAAPTPASDVWSLGATVYFTVEGRPPGRPAPRPRRAGILTPTLNRLLTPEPEARPASAVVPDMFAAAATVNDPRGPLRRPPNPGRRRRRLIAGAIAALVVGSGATWLLWPERTIGTGTAIASAIATSASTPTPSDIAAPTSDSVPSAGHMAAFVSAHYAWLPHDPVAAWDEYAPTLQAYVGYAAHNTFWSTVAALATSGVKAHQESMTVQVTLTYVMNSGAKFTEEHQLQLGIDPERPGNLVIESDTLLA